MHGKTIVVIAVTLFFSLFSTAQEPHQRRFAFHYAFTIKDVPAGKELHVWIPLAHADAFQDVQVVSKTGDLKLRKMPDDEYGNVVLYAEADTEKVRDYRFSIDYDVIRFERVDLVDGKLAPGAHPEKSSAAVQARFLQPDKLVPVTGVPAELAATETKGAATTIDKAHAIYSYVLRTMKYDKTGTGWGHGDTLWACDEKRGNCTDFHSVFISMARSQHIPARFEIGFPLPADKHSAEIPGYHCWSEFYVDSTGWIPVDISEAWKHPEKKDYFFGAHDENRFQLTAGRDLKLNPPQDGQPLNYFVYPYVEVGGKEYSNVSMDFSFHDVGTQGNSASR